MDSSASEIYPKFRYRDIPMYIIGLYGVVSNVLLLIAFIKDPLKCFKNSATYLVANLAVSDFMVSLCQPYKDWIVHLTFRAILTMATSVSMLTIISIAADRCLMVTYPFKHHYMMSGRKITIWLTFVWVSSLIVFIRSIGFREKKNIYQFSVSVYLTVTIILVTSILYVLTFISLRKQARKLALQNESGLDRSQEIRLLKERRFLWTIFLVAFITFIGIVPFSILMHVSKIKGIRLDGTLALPLDILNYFLSVLFLFTFANNPLIYFLRLRNYRKTFHLLYCRKRASN